MKFNITSTELWFWRIVIIGLIIFCGILAQGNRQAQYMGLKNAELILTTEKEITEILKTQAISIIIERAMSEDYPPKKSLGSREWCENKSCLIN